MAFRILLLTLLAVLQQSPIVARQLFNANAFKRNFTEKAFMRAFSKTPLTIENLEAAYKFVSTYYPDSFENSFQKFLYRPQHKQFILYQVPFFRKGKQDDSRNLLYTFLSVGRQHQFYRIDTLLSTLRHLGNDDNKDLNGDGIKDLLLFTGSGARGCNAYYEVMLYNKKYGLKLLKYTGTNQLSTPVYDSKRKWIVSNNCTAVAFEHYYTVVGDSLKLIGWTTIETDEQKRTFTDVYYSFRKKEIRWKLYKGDFEQASNLIYKMFRKRKI